MIQEKRVALITGASRGIGKALSQYLSEKGIEILEPKREDLDLASVESVSRYIEKNRDLKIDILINNAGINPVYFIDDLPVTDLQEVIQVNLTSPILLSKMVFPGMKERGFGRIVNISSIWSKVGKPGRSPYAATKAGIAGFCRHIALEGAPYGVLVNTVAPGFVNTELTRKNNSSETIGLIESNIPMKRMAEPSEIAAFIAFLVSGENTYITGQEIFIDGGYTIR